MDKIVVLDGYAENPGDLSWAGFERFGEVTVYDRTPAQDVVSRIGDAAYVLTNKTVLDEAVLTQCPTVRYVGVLATGFNVVDVKAAAGRGITVTNIPGYGTDTVAQYTMALLLELCHHIGAHADSVRDGDWGRCPDFCYWKFPQMELSGKVMGIIGYGRIGKRTAKLAEAFGMKILVHSGHPVPKEALTENIRQASLAELLSSCDVISLHCPLTEKTRGIINRESIAQMKDGVMILNSSRGPLICEEDLKEALISGKVAGAAADVLSVEPPSDNHPLLDAPNMLITPHIAWASREARERLMQTAVEDLAAFVAGDPVNVVS
ncbi:MAG: D-2-hydroxyacid dehydrogenase [Lachnospiraceae bacterium]|nr:D-2-hydroxyacid dehydrogenase [Lachnospiraceae bacterium]